MLVPVSAGNVRCIIVEIELDAGLITWFATVHCPWLIAEALRSRIKEFLIQMPRAKQSRLMAASVVALAIKDSGIDWSQSPDRWFMAAVAYLSAREIYQATVFISILQKLEEHNQPLRLRELKYHLTFNFVDKFKKSGEPHGQDQISEKERLA